MYQHVKRLMYTGIGVPDPRFNNMLLEQFGASLLPGTVKAQLHRKMAEPGSVEQTQEMERMAER
jgi:hypothetical protein